MVEFAWRITEGKYVKRFLTYLICSIFISSCATVPKRGPSPLRPISELFQSFVRISTISPTMLCGPERDQPCYPTLSSGALVTTDKGVTGVLTVAHSFLFWVEMTGGNQPIQTWVALGNGEIVRAQGSVCDFRLDVCFLFIDNDKAKGLHRLEIADDPPVYAEQYRYMGDPAGVSSSFQGQVVPILGGYFSGAGNMGNRRVGVFSFAGTQGASGGPIFDEDDDIVGIVQMVNREFPHATLSITHSDLVRFLTQVTPYENYKTK